MSTLQPVGRSRAYELAAGQIKQLIRDGVWKVGDRIPSERELADQLAISRGSTREALRMLEAMGWVEIRPGEGAIVRDVSRLPLKELNIGVSFDPGARLGELWETRKLIEPHAAFLASERRSDQAIEQIEEAIQRMEAMATRRRWRDAIAQNPDFHLAVARASENTLLVQIQLMLNEASEHAAQQIGPDLSPERVANVIRDHRAILEAIRAGDSLAAQKGGLEHLISSWMAEWQ